MPIIPFGHQYLVTEPFDPPLTALPTLRDPDRLVYFRTEVGGLVQGGYERNPVPWALDGVPPASRPRCCRRTGTASRSFGRTPSAACRRWRRRRSSASSTGRRRSPPTASSASASPSCRASGSLRASARTAWPAPAASARSWPSGSSTASPSTTSGTWTSSASAATTAASATPSPRTYEGLAVLRHQVPGRGAKSARPLRVSPAYPAWRPSTRRSARRPAGSAPTGSQPTRPPATRLCARAAGPGQSGRPRSAPRRSHAARRRHLRPVQLRQARGARPRGHGVPGAAPANAVDRPVGSIVYTQLLNPRGGIECDLSVTRLAPIATSSSPAPRSATTTAPGSSATCPPTAGQVRDVTSARRCFCVWGPRARDILQPLTRTSLANADFPYLTARELTLGHVPLLAARVTYVGELGWELYAPTEYALGAVGRDLGGGRRARPDRLRLPRHRRPAAGEGLPRLGERPDARDDAGRGRARLGGAARQAGRLRRPRRARERARPARPPRASLPAAGRPARRRARLRARARPGGEPLGRVTSGGYGYAVERSIALAYLPPEATEVGTRLEVDIFGDWVGAEVAAEPLYDPRARASAPEATAYAVARTSTTKLVRSPRKKPTAYSSGRSSWS